jgi:hypothetical protein
MAGQQLPFIPTRRVQHDTTRRGNLNLTPVHDTNLIKTSERHVQSMFSIEHGSMFAVPEFECATCCSVLADIAVAKWSAFSSCQLLQTGLAHVMFLMAPLAVNRPSWQSAVSLRKLS